MPNKWLIGAAALLAVLLLGSVIVALTQSETVFPEDTPEGTVQRFLAAFENGDFVAAHVLLTEEMKSDCPVEMFAERIPYRREGFEDSRVTLEDKRVLDGKTLITARVTRISRGSPFGTSEYSDEYLYTLAEEGGGVWRFVRYPKWPYYGCPGPREAPAHESPAPAPTLEPAATPETTSTPSE